MESRPEHKNTITSTSNYYEDIFKRPIICLPPKKDKSLNPFIMKLMHKITENNTDYLFSSFFLIEIVN
jgi:hypothetical protein